MTRQTTPFAALQAASKIARERLETAPNLARAVKRACPEISQAACRRAADRVLDVRLSEKPTRYARTPKSRSGLATIAEKLDAHKRRKVRRAFEASGFRCSRAWDDDGTLTITFGAPSIHQSTTEGWINYKSKGYKRGIVAETVSISVPRDWGSRVKRLDTTNGLLLLDAEQLPTDGPVNVYRAVWARQGRGVSLVTESGYLARHAPSGTQFHSTHRDPEKALTGLKRQLNAQAVPAEVRDARRAERAAATAERRSRQLSRLVNQVARHDLSEIAHVQVGIRDSFRAGNCEPGTYDFAERFFPDLDPARDSVTIGEIAVRVGLSDPAQLAGADLTLARQLAAACLVAIRRDRNARRLLASV